MSMSPVVQQPMGRYYVWVSGGGEVAKPEAVDRRAARATCAPCCAQCDDSQTFVVSIGDLHLPFRAMLAEARARKRCRGGGLARAPDGPVTTLVFMVYKLNCMVVLYDNSSNYSYCSFLLAQILFWRGI